MYAKSYSEILKEYEWEMREYPQFDHSNRLQDIA